MENSVAIYLSSAPIYWHSIIIALAAVAAILCASVLRSGQSGSAGDIFSAALIGFLPAMLLGRVYYCYFAQENFADPSEMYQLGKGGYALYGVMAGYLIVILIYCRLTGKKAGPLLDAIAPAAALGIAIGRAASYFSGDDFGRAVTDPADQHLPFAVFSETRGEWNIAVFSLEAIAALAVFLVLMLLFTAGKAGRFNYRDGDTMLLFMFLYGIPQTVFESMRNDSLFLISLGFVRISQIVSIVMATAVFVVFSIRSAKRGVTRLHILGWSMCLVRIALAFWMEFCITNETAGRNHTIMSLCLLFYMFVGLALYFDGSGSSPQSKQAPDRSGDHRFAARSAVHTPPRMDAPADFRSDVPIRTYNILVPNSDEVVSDGGRYMVRIRSGAPSSRVMDAYPILSRTVINVTDGSVHLQDIFDLTELELECVSDYTAAVPDGNYRVTLCAMYQGTDSPADHRNIYIYFARQNVSAGRPPYPQEEFSAQQTASYTPSAGRTRYVPHSQAPQTPRDTDRSRFNARR